MSGRIVAEVLDYAPEDLTDSQFLTLIALAESARDQTRTTKTTTAKVARRIRRSPGTVRNAIVELTRRALIAPTGRPMRGHAQDYRLHQLEAHHRATTVSFLEVTRSPTDTDHDRVTPRDDTSACG